jgi:hypothetical protein
MAKKVDSTFFLDAKLRAEVSGVGIYLFEFIDFKETPFFRISAWHISAAGFPTDCFWEINIKNSADAEKNYLRALKVFSNTGDPAFVDSNFGIIRHNKFKFGVEKSFEELKVIDDVVKPIIRSLERKVNPKVKKAKIPAKTVNTPSKKVKPTSKKI